MNVKKAYVLLIAVVSLSMVKANAQKSEKAKYEFGINGFYGLSGLNGSISNGSIGPGLSYMISANNKYYLTSHFGFGIGAGYVTSTSKANLDSYISNTPAVDDEGESFEYRVTASGIYEDLKISVIEIPIFMTFRKSTAHKIGFQSSAGLKASFPIEATYRCTDGSIETRGYYASNHVEFGYMPNHGFQKVEEMSYSDNLSKTIAFSVVGDIGIAIPMGMMGLNVGVYGSYGLTPLLNPSGGFLMDYPGNYHSITSLSGKVSLVSGGVCIGINFLGGLEKQHKIKAAKYRTDHGGRN